MLYMCLHLRGIKACTVTFVIRATAYLERGKGSIAKMVNLYSQELLFDSLLGIDDETFEQL